MHPRDELLFLAAPHVIGPLNSAPATEFCSVPARLPEALSNFACNDLGRYNKTGHQEIISPESSYEHMDPINLATLSSAKGPRRNRDGGTGALPPGVQPALMVHLPLQPESTGDPSLDWIAEVTRHPHSSPSRSSYVSLT